MSDPRLGSRKGMRDGFSTVGEFPDGMWKWEHPFDLSRSLPVGGGLLVPYSLSGSPVIKQLMQIVTIVPGQGGRFQSVCFS